MATKTFVKHMAAKTGATFVATDSYLRTVESELYAYLKENGTVKFAGLTLTVEDVPAHDAINPKTKDPVVVAAHKKIKVKVSSTVKNLAASF